MQSRQRALVYSSVVIALITSGILLLNLRKEKSGPPRKGKRRVSAPAKDDRLRRELGSLNRRLLALSMKVTKSGAKVDGQPSPDSPLANTTPYGEFPADPTEHNRWRKNIIHNDFAAQSIDRKWAAHEELRIATFLDAQEKLEPGCCEIEAIECRHSMCKTVIRHDDRQMHRVYAKAVRGQPFVTAHRTETTDDYTKTTIYSSREGHSFPFYTPGEGATLIRD